MLQEFKPTLYFLLKFFGIYLGLSWLYGVYIGHYDSNAPAVLDPITRGVSAQCTEFCSALGYETLIVEDDHLNQESLPEQTYDSIWINDSYAISVEEGCNGINIMILFLAFVVGFGGQLKNSLIFIPLGLLFIHLANLGRLLLLSFVNIHYSAEAFHFFHKYGFTAIIYLAVLFLWYLWVMRFSGRLRAAKAADG